MANMAGRSMLDAFLNEILNSIKAKDGHHITDLIQLDFENLDPSRQKPYADLNIELNNRFPPGNDEGLSARCKEALPLNVLGAFHSSFSESLIQYFRYLRDFTTADNQSKALEIRQLTSQCITALGDSKYGVIMIPIVLSFSRVLAKIATNLDRNPNLLQQASQGIVDNEEAGRSKVSFVESTANVLRDAFIKCLAGSPGLSRASKPNPDDKRYGIYLTANSCLKLLFQCRKIRNAQQMFTSIDAQSPPLSFYPAAQRVTYLYYLGRYHFANNHFYRAQVALQSAYDQCHREAKKHRRIILIYLVASNLCLGRFPSSQLFTLPESEGLAFYFRPLCNIVRSGDLGAFENFFRMTPDNQFVSWFLHRRILLQLQNRCEVLTWRSLIRRVFVIGGYKGEQKKIPFLRLPYLQSAARWALQRLHNSNNALFPITSEQPIGFTQSKTSYIDPEFAGIDQAINETGFDIDTGSYNDTMINQITPGTNNNHHHQLSDTPDPSPTIDEIESTLLSLIQQGFLRGFVLHTTGNPRFAIPGSSAGGGPVAKGFPNIWETVVAKAMDGDGDGDTVPGWVKDESVSNSGGIRAGGALGGVVRLSGARAVGMGS